MSLNEGSEFDLLKLPTDVLPIIGLCVGLILGQELSIFTPSSASLAPGKQQVLKEHMNVLISLGTQHILHWVLIILYFLF